MAGPKDVTIRAQALDQVWQVIGGDSARGLYPENVTLEADLWGPSRASFNLRRDPTSFWPDIGAFTPVEIDVGSTLVWSGRVLDTPSRVAQRVMNVQCQGWQYHLDDDVYDRFYVNTRIGDWKDIRTFLTADLTSYVSGVSVASDNGVAVLSWPKGATIVNSKNGGIGIDLGPAQVAKRIIVDYDAINGSGNASQHFAITTHTTGVGVVGANASNVADVALPAGSSSGTLRATINHRYLYISIYSVAGADFTTPDELTVRIKAIRVFAETVYESGDLSVLKASDVVADALSRATVLLSSDQSGIQATSFSMPEYNPGGPQTSRQAWAAVDSYHDWLKQIDVQRRPIYQPKPSRPIFEVGAWSPLDDDDSSANSGEEIYNRVLVQAQTPDGAPVRTSRSQGQQSGVTFDVAVPVPDNPTFATNTTAWAATTSVITRDTVTFDTAPASGRWDNTGASDFLDPGDKLSTTFSGTFVAGTPYLLQMRVRSTVGGPHDFTAAFGHSSSGDVATSQVTLQSGAFNTYSVAWTPKQTRTSGVTFELTAIYTLTAYLNIDSLSLWSARPTLVDRRSFVRSMILPVQSALPSDGVAAGTIGDLWLVGHKTTPFKGSATLSGDGSLRNVLTGVDVPLEQLLLNTGQLVRLSDRSDPDTGGHGRDGRVVQVSYQPATNQAQVTFDNSRTDLSTLLSRLAVVQGR